MAGIWRLGRPLLRTAHIGRRCISTVEVGTTYENLVVATFNQLGAALERVGGASDNGIDFYGRWALPNHSEFFVAGQCKHYERKKIGPSVIREWEGVMSRQDTDTLGVVVATSGFTTGGVHAALSSAYPIALVTMASPLLEPKNTADDEHLCRQSVIRGFVWNRAAEPFIGRLVIAKKHFDVRKVELVDPAEFAIQLFWDGQPLPVVSAPPCLAEQSPTVHAAQP
ncbi:hypothetical protein H4R23_003961 [Coemansia sp. Cherry 401B]|nr:hypothetical protein IWW54_004415 [Coemansia sp. RSA 2705]KAJ2727253.1 hypothetical protein H4R23_003961 [Coemansia sp. Cherry 401B]